MSFEIKAEGVDVERLLADVHNRIEERRKAGLYTDEELRYIAERAARGRPRPGATCAPTSSTSSARATRSGTSPSTRRRSTARAAASSGGRSRPSRRLLRPVQKLFWNPNPMIAALSRQSDLNRFSVHLLHNLVLELSRLNLEVQELRNRNLQLAGPPRGARAAGEDARGHGGVPRRGRRRTGAREGPPAPRRALLRRRDRQRGAGHPAPAARGGPRVGHLRGARPPAGRPPRAARSGSTARSPRPTPSASSTSRSAAPPGGSSTTPPTGW